MSRIKRVNVRYGQIVFDLDDIDRIMEECTFASVPARKTDYQAYLRKALKILNDMLLLKNMPADFPAEKI